MAGFLDGAGLARLWDHVKQRLDAKQDKLAGQAGQVVGFGEDGTAVAQDAVTMDDVDGAIYAAITGAIEEGY